MKNARRFVCAVCHDQHLPVVDGLTHFKAQVPVHVEVLEDLLTGMNSLEPRFKTTTITNQPLMQETLSGLTKSA